MSTRISDTAATAACDAVVDLLDGGAGAATIEIRTGTQPAGVDAIATGTLLGTLTCTDPAFGASGTNPATATAASITSDTNADASGTAGWFRGYDSNAVAVIDGNITTTAVGTGDMLLDDTAIVAGGTIAVTSWTVTMPDGS